MSKKISLSKRHILDLPYDCLLYVTDFFSQPSEANCFLRTCKTFHRLLNDVSVYCGCTNVEFHFTLGCMEKFHRRTCKEIQSGEPGIHNTPSTPGSPGGLIQYDSSDYSDYDIDGYFFGEAPRTPRSYLTGVRSDTNGQSLSEFFISMLSASFYPYVKNIVLGERFVIHASMAMTFLLRFPFLKSVAVFTKKGLQQQYSPNRLPSPLYTLDLTLATSRTFSDGTPWAKKTVDLKPPNRPEHFGDFLFGTILPKFKLLESISFVLANELAPVKFFPFFRQLENIKVLSFSLQQCTTLDDEVLLKMKKLNEVHIHGLTDGRERAFGTSSLVSRQQVVVLSKIKTMKFLANLDKLFFYCNGLSDVRRSLSLINIHRRLRDDVSFHSEAWNLLYSFQSLGCCKVYINPCCSMKLIDEYHSIPWIKGERERINLKCLSCLSCRICRTLPTPPISKPPECTACGKIACADCLTDCNNCGYHLCKRCFGKSPRLFMFGLCNKDKELKKKKAAFDGGEECYCEQHRIDSLNWCTTCKSRGLCAVKICRELKCLKCSSKCSFCMCLTCNSHYQQQEKSDSKVCCVCKKGGCLKCLFKCLKCSLYYHSNFSCGSFLRCGAKTVESGDKDLQPNFVPPLRDLESIDIDELYIPTGLCHKRVAVQGPFAEYCKNCIFKSADMKEVAQHLQEFRHCSRCDMIFCLDCKAKCHLCENACVSRVDVLLAVKCIDTCDICTQLMCRDCKSSAVKEFCEMCEYDVMERFFKCCKECEKTIEKRLDLAECQGCNKICCKKCSRKCQDCQAQRCFRKKQFLLSTKKVNRSILGLSNSQNEMDLDCLVRCWGCSKAVCSGCVQVHPVFGVLCSQCSTECEKDEWKDLFKK